VEFGLIGLTAIGNRHDEQEQKKPDNLTSLEGIYHQAGKTYMVLRRLGRLQGNMSAGAPSEIVLVMSQLHRGGDRKDEQRHEQAKASEYGVSAIIRRLAHFGLFLSKIVGLIGPTRP
jgi:hypothetical protein